MAISKQEQKPNKLTKPEVSRTPDMDDAPLETVQALGGLKTTNLIANIPPDVPSARPLRQKTIAGIQRRLGNSNVMRLMKQDGLIQRHPEGAGLSVDESKVASEVQSPAPAQLGVGGAISEPIVESTAAPAAAEGPTPTTPATTPPTTTPATTTPAAATTPAPATSMAMDSTRAQEVLNTTFGTVHRMIPVTTVLLEDNAATLAKYDQISAGRNNIFVTPNRPWQAGDAQAAFGGLNGFADNGTIYVNKQTTSPTTTCHEMLHLNTAGGFRAAVGETINEGTTQMLTIKALQQAGVALPASLPYAGETAMVRKLAAVVGEGPLTSAYFGGPDSLIAAFNAIQGEGMFALMKARADAKDWTGADRYLQPPSVQQKIAIINDLLDWWVSDNDLDNIGHVVNSLSDADKATVRNAIQPRISSLTSIGQRTRLRVILGTV
jgi:hypothetical protein